MVARRVADRSRHPVLYGLSRVAYAGAVTVLMAGMLVSFGGLGYAAAAPGKAVKAVQNAVGPERSRVVQKSSSKTQYEPQKVTICHVRGNGRRVTITISESALPAHLRHGDSLGACPAGVAGVGGGSTDTTGVAGAGVSGGSLPFTGLSLLTTLLLGSLLIGVGLTLRRMASRIE